MLGEYRITGRGAAEIAAGIERAVGAGELAPGQPLPPLRELASTLGVNPNTVAAAYRTLRDRGVVETAGRRGTRVRHRPATAPRESARVEVPPDGVDLAAGNPDPALLPPLGEAFAAAAAAPEPVLYGAPDIDPGFEALAREMLAADGVPADALAVTSGSLDAIERVLAAHLRPGDRVAVEDPGWGSLLDLVPALGLRPVPVALDDEGPLPAALEEALDQGARALVLTARAQNPTGAAVTAERAALLREVLAARPETLLVEDDHGHGIVDLPLHPLSGATRHWALARSAAKAYGPDLRLAVLAGDAVTVDRVRGRQRLGPGWVSHLLQRALVHLWRTDAVDPGAVAASYGRRRARLLEELAARGVTGRGRSGMNVWIPVAEETGPVARLLREGWAVAPGARFRLASAPGLRVTVSPLDDGAARRLAEAVAAAVRPASPRRYE
ncbi:MULTISPECIES: aminotransferase class I/II-fold pyridoxal phosphate-dependent enzyme [Streptomyces]|uniref:GntR family transcriptional regulator n=1 Tax=Streptomyces cacaoi TaxID=1898 RepID=A0A4Y3QSI6_STRCI|nr:MULTISPECIES: aminotransferase class I/II-fold pyridoxal phosphate-dependent enzyme [Streptomyces]NNG85996.1 aminotransferase class I/II-fold pyridoxal phosphate-dependent enzyme [Streptomyces cacaoi]QHF94815.1 GntR family transcriptional regulator [Streptomyces sp. NHF165]GEB48162.1 GntR family transcriptional regulator [Streptomyces cacaoi]